MTSLSPTLSAVSGAGKRAFSIHIRACALAWRRERDLQTIDRVEAEVQALRPNTRALLAVLRAHMRATRRELARVPNNVAVQARMKRLRIALAGEALQRKGAKEAAKVRRAL
jgi:hypothetical protein